MNRFVMLIAGAAMGMFATVASASDMKTIAAATFKLYDGNSGMCSVTFLGNDKDGALFLTANHCVDGSNLNLRRQKLDAKTLKDVLSEQVVYVKVVRSAKGNDIAILQAKDKDIKFPEKTVDIATLDEANALVVGDPVMVAGYPAAEMFAFTKGEFTGKVPAILDMDVVMYQTTVPVAGGNSGGALYGKFGDEYKLIGTTTAKRTDNDIMTYFQTAESVASMLKGFVKLPDAEKPSNKLEAPKELKNDVNPGMGIDQR